MNLAPSTGYQFVLSGINALVSFLYVGFRSSPVTSDHYTTFIQGASQYDVHSSEWLGLVTWRSSKDWPIGDNRNDTMIINMEYSDNLFNVESDQLSYLHPLEPIA